MKIVLSKIADRQLKKAPAYIFRKYLYWIDLIYSIGLREARKYKGFHDEPLKGKRKGERSVRLSKEYRLIYQELSEDKATLIEILEINKHEY